MNFIKLFNLLTYRDEYINPSSIFIYHSKILHTSNDEARIEGTYIRCTNGYEIEVTDSVESFEMMLETSKQESLV